MNPVVVVHGGAWAIPDFLVENSLAGVRKATKVAWKILADGGCAVDAVEAAIVVLENDPVFDAGTGSVLTAKGKIEMDAMIMDGKTLQAGAVACVENIRNPIKLARIVMEKTDHILLVGKGANDFAEENGIPSVPMEQLVTVEAIEAWERYKAYNNSVKSLFSDRNGHTKNLEHDTVGCVAMDKNGSLASGTSTGGITAKMPGRVGDSPLIGSGAYADNNYAAVSCTGHGESIAKVCLAKGIVDGCGAGLTPSTCLKTKLLHMTRRVGGSGGAICIDAQGRYGCEFTTERMAWAMISNDVLECGINPNDKFPF